jgi:hypothetical protein
MTCHSQLWTNADALAPVRESFTEGRPIPWNRVHDQPDYVYFDHSIHIDHRTRRQRERSGAANRYSSAEDLDRSSSKVPCASAGGRLHPDCERHR